MRCLWRFASILKNKSLMVVPIVALLAAVYWWQTVLAVLLGMVKLVFGMILYNLLRVVIIAALLLFCGPIRWLLAMAQADGQGSVTFSDQDRSTEHFSDTSCSSQIKDTQERGKEPESGTGMPDRLRDWIDRASSRELDRTRRSRKREAREEECPDSCGTLSRASLPRPSIFRARL